MLKAVKVVAPFMGAWIETSSALLSMQKNSVSHPSWVRGLKLTCGILFVSVIVVAPFMGAWIETVAPTGTISLFAGRTLHGCVD